MENTKNAPRDTFLYLLSIITLITSAVAFGSLVFGLINIWFPDALQPYASVNYTSIRLALATLIVSFPVFFWVSLFLHNDVTANPEKRDAKIRRWLMYLTVFAAGLVVIGDLVTLIYSFLQGDLTMPFVLKVLVVFFIAGSSLFYYLNEVKNRSYPRHVFRVLIIGVVVLAVVSGFYKAGSPQSQRLIRFDQQKVSDLSVIQNQLVYYWQQKGSLPANLSLLNDPISGFTSPIDPQSNQVYEYRLVSMKVFQLCAEFNKPSEGTPSYPVGYLDNWQHSAGRVCFDRSIDSVLYPVKPAPVR